jgi:hypothetical protein
MNFNTWLESNADKLEDDTPVPNLLQQAWMDGYKTRWQEEDCNNYEETRIWVEGMRAVL